MVPAKVIQQSVDAGERALLVTRPVYFALELLNVLFETSERPYEQVDGKLAACESLGAEENK